MQNYEISVNIIAMMVIYFAHVFIHVEYEHRQYRTVKMCENATFNAICDYIKYLLVLLLPPKYI